MNTDRHAQDDLHAARVQPSELAQQRSHPERRAARTLWVLVAVEQQQQRVAAELQQTAPFS